MFVSCQKRKLDANAYRDALTFKVWSTFYQMYPKQKDLSHQFRVLLNNDDAAKESVIAALGSLNQDCLRTFFCDTDFSDTSLVSLTEISSLAALAFCSELGLLWPLDEWPLDETIYKDWCRVVKERKALTELKTLYLQEMIQDVPALLHSLSALPDLTLVGFANDSVLEDVNNRRDFIPQMKAHGQWVPASDDQMIQFTDLIYAWGAYSQLAIADRLRLLYDFANEISHTSSAGTGAKASEHAQDGEKVTLSMTDDSIQVPRTKKQLLWYIRKEPPKRSFSKRQRETQTVTATAADKEYSGAKKRKARQTEQQDIWCLLGQFG